MRGRERKITLILTTGILLIIITEFIGVVSAIETGGYVVEPAYGISPDYTNIYFGDLSGDYDFLQGPGPEKIGYWELPIMIILILIVIGLISSIFYTVKLFLSGKISFIYGLSKIKKKDILENESRRKVYDTILQNPGIQLCEIEKLTGFTNKNSEYHIKKLLSYSLIVYKQTSRGKGYFQNSNTYSLKEKIVYMHSKNPTEKRIIEIIHENPGITRKELSGVIKISAPSVSWYITGLTNDNILKKERVGTRVHYYINDSFKTDISNLINEKKAVVFNYEIPS